MSLNAGSSVDKARGKAMQQLQYKILEADLWAQECPAQCGRPNVLPMTQICCAVLIAGILTFYSSAGLCQTDQSAPDQRTKPASGPLPTLSKFEARRIRHRCRDLVGGGATGKELRHCFEMNVAARRLWGECKRKAQSGNLHGREKEEAVKRCITEKLGSAKPKEP